MYTVDIKSKDCFDQLLLFVENFFTQIVLITFNA